MTDDQIERRVERMMNYLDRIFLAGQLTQKQYDTNVADLYKWAEAQYNNGRR